MAISFVAKVQQQGDHYLVHLSNGQIQVAEQQVEMVCQNIEEAYLRRRGDRVGSTADSHLELARWCLRHNLLGHAGDQLQEAEATDAEHPQLARLQRQLKQSLQMEHRQKKRQQAAANVPPKPAPLDPAALEKAPKWARALFVRQIQPLVVHSCATTGCHQTGSGTELPPGGDSHFHLNRLALEGAGHPEATLRNLAAMLEQIDWQSAGQSNLLQRAREAHGSLTASTPLPPHKLQVLQGWVEQLAEAHRKDTELRSLPLLAEAASQPPTPELELLPPDRTPNEVRPASFESVEPVDPFDPSVFNRRFATVTKAVTKAAVTKANEKTPEEPRLTLLPAIE